MFIKATVSLAFAYDIWGSGIHDDSRWKNVTFGLCFFCLHWGHEQGNLSGLKLKLNRIMRKLYDLCQDLCKESGQLKANNFARKKAKSCLGSKFGLLFNYKGWSVNENESPCKRLTFN